MKKRNRKPARSPVSKTKPEEVLQTLRQRGLHLATAESLTGGGVGQALTSVPGSSEVYKGGIVSYTNEIKQNLLHVSEKNLERFGAVSAPVALEMAKGAREALNAEVGISTTGLAGPGGDDFGNPVGTVFIACDWDGRAVCRECHFTGSRDWIRIATIDAALKLALEVASGEAKGQQLLF